MSDDKRRGCFIDGGVSFCGLLFIVMFIMKTCKIGVVATWSWWWVTAPLWVPFAVSFIIFIVWLIFYFISEKF